MRPNADPFLRILQGLDYRPASGRRGSGAPLRRYDAGGTRDRQQRARSSIILSTTAIASVCPGETTSAPPAPSRSSGCRNRRTRESRDRARWSPRQGCKSSLAATGVSGKLPQNAYRASPRCLRDIKSTIFFSQRLTRRKIAEIQETERNPPKLSRTELAHTMRSAIIQAGRRPGDATASRVSRAFWRISSRPAS